MNHTFEQSAHLEMAYVLSSGIKIASNGNPYLQVKVYNRSHKELTCNKFFCYAKDATFDQKLDKIAAYAKDLPDGASCVVKTGVLQNPRSIFIDLKVIGADIYATECEALTDNPGASIYKPY